MSTTTNPPAVWRGAKKFPHLIGKKGIVRCFTILHAAAEYAVAIIRIKDSTNQMTIQICREGIDKLKVGAQVVLLARKFDVNKDGLIKYTIKGKLL